MKNIHIILTNKPSRLYKSKITQDVFISDNMSQHGDATYNVNIYITSEEEIKEGDWCISKINNKIFKKEKKDIIDDLCNKIILTTDQDLIKDGVQPIDDEFLEWFVKNPSCESVEVEDYYNPTNMVYGINTSPYKIIIPKEEPKLRHQQIIDAVGGEDRFRKIAGIKPKQEYKPNSCDIIFETAALIENKQETLEEAAERLSKDNLVTPYEKPSFKNGFIEGANWVANKMYSEEEVLSMLRSFDSNFNQDELKESILKKWFEQFKKK